MDHPEDDDEIALPPEQITALELLQYIYRNPNLSLSVRHRAARDAIKYETPALGVVAHVEGFGDLLEAEIKRRKAYTEMKLAQGYSNVRVIEAAPEIKPGWRRF